MSRRAELDYEKVWRWWWAPILVSRRGRLKLDQIKRELSDYHRLQQRVGEVYCHVTDGRVSDPSTTADAVIDQADAVAELKIQEAIKEQRQVWKAERRKRRPW